jgi:2,4-dienoyl-CoA reductase-like NADH-dependent reductase (Old Yellow Enzyme family)
VGPDFPISVKLNSADFQEGGFTPAEAVQVSSMLETMGGIDLLEISGGNYESGIFGESKQKHQQQEEQQEELKHSTTIKRQSTIKREAYFLEYAIEIQKTLKTTPVLVTGGWRAKHLMERAIR